MTTISTCANADRDKYRRFTRGERESREHSRKSSQNQIKEIRTLMSKQLPHQRSCQDVRMDPRYQKPPHYADIHQH